MSNSTNHIQKEVFLKGAQSFTQFNFNQHLITVIGEEHVSAYLTCHYSPAISVSEYLIGKAKQNTTILLEISPEFRDKHIRLNSKNITDTYNESSEKNLLTNIKGFDIRPTLLPDSANYALYQDSSTLRKLSAPIIKEVFIYPLSNGEGIRNDLHVERGSMSDNDYNYLENFFLPDVVNHCAWILNKLNYYDKEEDGQKDSVIISIMELWKKIADYQIIREIFKLSTKNNLAVLCGEKHAHNLREVFRDLIIFQASIQETQSANYNTNKTVSCLNLKNAYIFLE